MDNYGIQAQRAKERFLTYDQEAIIRKFRLRADEAYLYFTLLGEPYRLSRSTGDLEVFREVWQDGNGFGQVMTALDILCDAREDRFLTGRVQPVRNFGRMFHTRLSEEHDPLADRFQADPREMARRCRRMGALPVPGGDLAFEFPVMDGLTAILRFWQGDGEFQPRILWFFDENALMYLRYETMYFAVGLIRDRLTEKEGASNG